MKCEGSNDIHSTMVELTLSAVVQLVVVTLACLHRLMSTMYHSDADDQTMSTHLLTLATGGWVANKLTPTSVCTTDERVLRMR